MQPGEELELDHVADGRCMLSEGRARDAERDKHGNQDWSNSRHVLTRRHEKESWPSLGVFRLME